MKTMKLSSRSKQSGQGLILIIIVAGIVLGLLWYLYSTAQSTQRDAIRYGHDVINRLAVNHDRSLLDQDLGAQAKMDMPPSQRDYMIQQFARWGAPAQPIQIADNVTFDSTLFGLVKYSPHGFFTAHLNYPAQPVTMQIAISQGATKWLIDNITVTMGQIR